MKTTDQQLVFIIDNTLYWKPLSQVLDDYANHKEAKSGDGVGLLPRLRMKIDQNLIKYVGKEVTNLDATNVLGVNGIPDSYTVYDNLDEKILQIGLKNAYKFGISRNNLISIQKKIRNKTQGVLKLHKTTIDKIIAGSIMTSGCEFIR